MTTRQAISLWWIALAAADETIQGGPLTAAWLRLFSAHLSRRDAVSLRWRGDLAASAELRRAYSALYGRYMARALLAREKDGNEFLARAKAICERSSNKREELEFEALANELLPNDPKRLTDHLGDTDRALSDRFVPDKRSLASLVRFRGGTRQWKVEFDRDAVSSRAVIYDPEANTITLTGLPDDLISQLRSEGLGHG